MKAGADNAGKDSGDEIAKVVGTRIAKRREALGLSQEGLADEAGLHRTTISPLELGKGGFRIMTLFRIAGVLTMAPSELLEGVYWVPDGGGDGHFTEEAPDSDGD